MEMRDLIIIGSGPAALSAAIYSGRASLSPLLITGKEIGGRMALSESIENYPGFPEGSGFELAQLMRQQAERFGAELLMDEVVSVDLSSRPFKTRTHEGEYQAEALIIATGASARRLGVPGEEDFTGRGVSFCATCDGFFYHGQTVVVVGGGNAAAKEALFLTKFASKVYMVHRGDSLRAEEMIQDQVVASDKIQPIWDTVVTEVIGNGDVTGVGLKNVNTGEESTLEAQGVFIFVGSLPNSELFKGQLELDEAGRIVTDERQRTSVEGVFAAGDVQEKIARQIATAVGSGARAAMQAEEFLAWVKG
jgi:thioredoxin reductase (NADPH)